MAITTTQSSLTENRLWELSRELRESTLFCGLSDDYPLVEKQNLFLMLAGAKPVTEVTSGHWESTRNGRRSVADDPVTVQDFLTSLGGVSRIRCDMHGVTAVVSMKQELLSDYDSAEKREDIRKIGLLFGYPKSAVDAYVGGHRLEWDRQAELLRNAGVDKVSGFIMSQQGWKAELAVLLDWQAVLKYYNLA